MTSHHHPRKLKLAYLQQSLFVFIIHLLAFTLLFACQVEMLIKTQKNLMFIIKTAIQVTRSPQTHSIVVQSFNAEYPKQQIQEADAHRLFNRSCTPMRFNSLFLISLKSNAKSLLPMYVQPPNCFKTLAYASVWFSRSMGLIFFIPVFMAFHFMTASRM